MIKLPIFILMWVLFLMIKAPTVLSGFFIIPLLYRYRSTHYKLLPWWTRPWANPEDWEGRGNGNNSLPKWWIEQYGNTFKEFYRYHAIRNPANGLRSFEWLDLDIISKLVEFKTNTKLRIYEPNQMRVYDGALKTAWYFAWQGHQAGFKLIHLWNFERHLVIKFGWRIEPSDAISDVINIGTEDASFATKILPWRKG